MWNKIQSTIEKYSLFFTISFFVLGIVMGIMFPVFGGKVNDKFSSFVDGYAFIAPIAIFLIIAPTLAQLFKKGKSKKFISYSIYWLSLRRIFACLWAVAFTALILGLPLVTKQQAGIWISIKQTLGSVGHTMLVSPYFWAMYAGIFVAFLAVRLKKLFQILEKAVKGIESIGSVFQPLIPLFMFFVGVYIVSLSKVLQEIKGETVLGKFEIFGFALDTTTAGGMIGTYLIMSLLIGVACFIWHLVLLYIVKRKVKGFSLKYYFSNYWIKVYPLLWATSSEALATPLNLYLTKKYFPEIKKEVRRFIVGMGSYININGTLICVFIVAGVVAKILGIQLSVFQMLLAIPAVFLMGYGVPGIPGELVLFAGILASIFGFSPEVAASFIAVYTGIQLGLPDSFRTGNNSTDDTVCALLLNEKYKEFNKVEEEVDNNNS